MTANNHSELDDSVTLQGLIHQINQTKLKLNQLHLQLVQKLNQESLPNPPRHTALSLDDYVRYGRQMIVSQVGLPGQLQLQRASVLVVGAGGLGCPALLYLARAGVGNISIVDHDTVELSNLHRQVLHSEFTVGMNKAESARINLLLCGTSVQINTYPIPFSMETICSKGRGRGANQIPWIGDFSVVLDCTDNPRSRYLISDACAAFGIPLVSGAGIRVEGQLSVWNLPPSPHSAPLRGPCYRCIFPESQDIQGERCADQGVVGPIVGSVGVFMAWETIRLLIGSHDLIPKLLLVPSFRTIKLRKPKKDCIGCSPSSREIFLDCIEKDFFQSTPPDEGPSFSKHNACSSPSSSFAKACSMSSQQLDSLASTVKRITPKDLKEGTCQLEDFHILDVRPQIQFEICSLPNSINIPIDEVLENPELTVERLKSMKPESDKVEEQEGHSGEKRAECRRGWLVVCRRGNDSLVAAHALNDLSIKVSPSTGARLDTGLHSLINGRFMDFVGGLEAYSLQIDPQFPLY